jgi:hypothetical protein
MRFLSIVGIAAVAALGCGSNKPVCTTATQATDCAAATPVCLVATAGNTCVQCVAAADCNSVNKTCSATNACVAKAATFTQPAGTVAVNFSVDDTANKVWKDKEMVWKGSMLYDPATNKVSSDATWGGPFAPLYDDGPWTAGGHEPDGAIAGDHIFGVTVFAPNDAAQAYFYGLCDAKFSTDSCINTGWVWNGSANGEFDVAAGATTAIKADGQTFKPFGTTDVQLTVDTSALLAGAWDTSLVQVKGSTWGWNLVTLTGSSGKYTFKLSDNVGSGKTYYHTGLTSSGDKPEFNFVFNGKEYKTSGTNAAVAGVTAGTKASGASSFTAATIGVYCDVGSDPDTNCTGSAGGGKSNTFITVP